MDASDLLVDYPGQNVSSVIDLRGRLHAADDGHFYFTGTGKRAKFFGPNFMVNTIFPPFADAPQQAGEYQDIVPATAADQLAVRLSRMGVNIVRLHFIDGAYGRPVSIWDPAYPHDTKHFDALQVSRLDYLIYRLKQHGIYCDINLHAGRLFRRDDGVSDYNQFSPLSFNKPATEFDPLMIQLQQQYATQLLSHVNPYTQLRLADDPAIAFVEISNEDSLLYSFANDQLATVANISSCLQGMACGLPVSHSSMLDHLWNAWLANKYGSDAAINSAWANPVSSADTFQTDLSSPSNGFDGWTLRCFNALQQPSSCGSSAGISSAGRIDLNQATPLNWEVQLDHSGLSIQNGQSYDLNISLRGTAGMRVQVDLIQDQAPYSFYQVAGSFDTSPQWTTVSTTFQAYVTNMGHVQLNIDLGSAAGTVWIGQISLVPHSAAGLQPAESTGSNSVARQTKASRGSYTLARDEDLQRFYYETQGAFFDGMKTYLRDTVGLKALITGTAVFGLPLDADLMSHQDFVDEHIYSDYPLLTDTANASSTWTIKNTAFSKDPLFLLFTWASLAVKGKPFTVTESGEPFPNDYAAEWLPWLTTFANFQGWDALMPTLYGAWPDNYFSAVPVGGTTNFFFGLSGNPVASAQYPVASRAFLASQNTVAAQQIALSANRNDLLQGVPGLVTGQFFGSHGYADWQALQHSVRTSYGDAVSSLTTYDGDAPSIVISDQGELTYDNSAPAAPVYKVDSPSLQGATGFLAGKTVHMSHLSVTVSPATAPFAAVTLQPVDRQPLLASRRLLLSILTRYENTSMSWNATRTSLGTNWGTAPSLIEPFSGTFVLNLRADSAFAVYALDAQGNRTKQVGEGSGTFVLSLNTGSDQTVWYEVVSTTAPAAPLPGLFYYVVAQNSGRCLDVRGGPSPTQDGAAIQQWACWGGDNQKWQVVPGPQGTFAILNKSSGRVVDVTGGNQSLSNDIPIQQWSFWGGRNQLWRLNSMGNGFEVSALGSGLCLDVIGGPSTVEDGAGIQQWACWGGLNQLWQFVPVPLN